jgi:Tfp pilus assembly protein PilF
MNHFTEGLREFEEGHFGEAVELFSRAIANGEEVPAAYSKRGVCQIRLGRLKNAEADFYAALSADARCVSAIVNLGNLMLERGNLDEANLYYERALRIDDTHALAHHNLGVLFRRKGEIGASIRELRLAAKYEAKPGTARKRLRWWRRR